MHENKSQLINIDKLYTDDGIYTLWELAHVTLSTPYAASSIKERSSMHKPNLDQLCTVAQAACMDKVFIVATLGTSCIAFHKFCRSLIPLKYRSPI